MTDKKSPVKNDDVDSDVTDDDEDTDVMLNSVSSDDSADSDDNRTASASQHGTVPKEKNRHVSAVDDRFFKLAEMEAFLDEQDVKEQRQHSGNAQDIEDDYDDDYDLSADVEVEAAYMYSDFFDPPDDDDAANDEKDNGADKKDEGIVYSRGEEFGDVSNEECHDKDKDAETDDDSDAHTDDDDDNDDDEQPPVKKAKLLADEDNVADSRQGAGSGEQLSSFEKR